MRLIIDFATCEVFFLADIAANCGLGVIYKVFYSACRAVQDALEPLIAARLWEIKRGASCDHLCVPLCVFFFLGVRFVVIILLSLSLSLYLFPFVIWEKRDNN